MITRIQIEGYKSIKKLDLELKPINILLGGNGVGKSNFISVFSLVRNVYHKNLQRYVAQKGGADSFLHFGVRETSEMMINFVFGNQNDDVNQFCIQLSEAQGSLLIDKTSTSFNSHGYWSPKLFERHKEESEFADTNRSQAYYVNPYLRSFEVYHFHDTSDKSPIKSQCQLDDNDFLRNDGSNLAAFLFYLKRKHIKHFARIEKMIKSVAPFFDGFKLKPSRLNEEVIKLEWREMNHPDSYFNAYHLSDGTLRFICLATLLMQPEPPKTIIIDEPELGLHPVAVNKLAALIRKASKKSQVIISTQSINLIDNFAPEDVIVTDRDSEQCSKFKRLDSSELSLWLDDYTLGDLWGKNQIGAQPYLD